MKRGFNRVKKGLAVLLSACMVFGMTPVQAGAEVTVSGSALQTESTGQDVRKEEKTSQNQPAKTVTGFEGLDGSVMYQQLAIGAKEEKITFPDKLTVTLRTQTKAELSGITWKLEETESDGAVFDSSKACNGYCYVYTPVLPETDADGDSIQVAEDAELPMIYVLIGKQQVMTLSVDHYDANGFCTGYELKSDGTWAKKEGEAACTEESCCGCQPADLTTGKYDIDGDGNKDEVYEIGNAGQLYWFAGLVNGDTGVCTGKVTRNLSANAVLTADITVNENVLKEDGTLSEDTSGFRSWTPIGYFSDDDSVPCSYSGRFDGQSHTISGLYFNDPAEWKGAGLFGEAESAAVISNVGVAASYFKGYSDVGGVCGRNYGTIRDSYNTGTVATMSDCIGGMCGMNSGGVLENCYNDGSINGGDFFAGGVCGENHSGTITNCHNTGSVSGKACVGGVCGRLISDEETNTSNGIIRDSYNTGKIIVTDSNSGVGGVCGHVWSGGTILNSYNIGEVTATGSNARIGGVCGIDYGTIANCYFDSTIYSGDAVGGGSGTATDTEGKTTDQFASGEVAWLLSQGCTIGEGDAAVTYDGSGWGQKLGREDADTYPVLDSAKKVYKGYNGSCKYAYSNSRLSQTPVHSFGPDGFCTDCKAYQPANLTTDQYDIDGDGSMDEVYEIGNAGQLYWFAGLVNGEESVCTDGVTQNYSANAVLTADITVNENVLKEDGTLSEDTSGFRSWTPIGNSSNYRGHFDGQSHVISGLYFSNADADYVGLFGTTEDNAVISNVGIRDSYFYGRLFVGGMCGRNYGTVIGCYNAGSVNGDRYVGGVCGTDYGTIKGSYNTGTVTLTDKIGFFVGGVCGCNRGGTIRSCYNTGKVTASGSTGGVCGYSKGEITGSYNTGEVTATGSGSYDNNTGGVCGENDGTITDSYNTGEVTASGRGVKAGGVCGFNEKGTLSNSYSAGKITVAASDGVAGGVCGTSEKTIANCYFDSTIYSGDAVGSGSGTATDTEGKTTDQFASGEVAWLLSQGCTIGEGDAAVTYDGSDWGQKLGGEDADTYPVLDSTKKVYKGYNGSCKIAYSNSQLSQTPVHSFGDDGFCTDCKVYQPAKLTTNQYDIDGDGSKDEVYEIGNAGQLYWFAGLVNGDESVCTDGVTQNCSANAVFTEDITVNENVLKSDGTLSDDTGDFRSWTPIGNNFNTVYGGHFDGQNHIVSGLYCNQSETVDNFETNYIGLFGQCWSSISNVGVVDSYFKGYTNVGGVCGYIRGSITNCYHIGMVSGNRSVGGVCGYATGASNCYHVGIVNANSKVGGICGRNAGTITNCYFDSTIYSGDAVGEGNGTVTDTEGKTTAQFASGEVAYLLSQGDTVWGQKLGEDGDAYPVFDSTKKVYMGYGESCKPPIYSNDESIVKPAPHRFGDDGFCTVCGAYQPAKLTTDQYDIDSNGSKDEVYEIGNTGQLYWFAGLVNGDKGVCTEGVTQNKSANAVLTADITVNENVLKPDGTLSDDINGFRSWTPIGKNFNTVYGGCFDGQNHTISGLYFSNPDVNYVGLFGTAEAAAISNVGIVDSYFKADSRVGSVCGYSQGEITDCYNAGSVIGCDDVGGVCGCTSQGEITGCYNIGMVTYACDTPASDMGGVCGTNYGTIKDSYNAGKVTASSTSVYAGGVCGYNSRTISGSYNTGEVTADGSGVKAGGVCGYNSGTISGSYNTGEVTADGSDGKVGGVCGYNSRTLSSSYNTGEVTADGSGVKVGGVCGYNYEDNGILSSSYNTGKVTAAASDGVAGGVCGVNDNTISNCCFDSTNYDGDAVGSGSGTATDTEGKTAAQFASGEAAYLLNGGTTDGSQKWYQNIDNDGTKDSIPVLDSKHGTVYKSAPCEIKYSNSDEEVPHNFKMDPEDDTRHICEKCGLSEKHEDVAIFTVDPEAHSISARCSSCGDLGTVTLSAEDAVYDGKDKAASVSGTIKGITILSIVYERKNGEAYTKIDGVPRDAGTYRAGITLGTGANAATVNVDYEIAKVPTVMTETPEASAITYGDTLADSALTGGKVVCHDADGNELAGTFAWEDGNIKPSVSDSDTTAYKVIFTPEDAVNYNTVETSVTLTVNKAAKAPKMPDDVMKPAHSITKVGEVPLPENWSWLDEDRDTALDVHVSVTAAAVYIGADKGNYEKESVDITLTRKECDQKNTVVKDQIPATCTTGGYSGDTYCVDCGALIKSGTVTDKLEHAYGISQYTWEKNAAGQMTCTAVKVCTRTGCADTEENHTVTEKVIAADTVTKKPTCETKGTKTYTAVFTKDGFTTQTKTEDIAVKAHTLTEVKAKEATATEAGNRAYFVCDVCGRFFEDSEGTKEITDKTSVVIPAKGMTPTPTPTPGNSSMPTPGSSGTPTQAPGGTNTPGTTPITGPTSTPAPTPGNSSIPTPGSSGTPTQAPEGTSTPGTTPITGPTDTPAPTPGNSSIPTPGSSDTPTQAPGGTSTPGTTSITRPTVTPGTARVKSNGTKFKDSTGATYVVTDAKSKIPTVQYKAPGSGIKGTVTIPTTVTIDNVTYKVTSIADNAFKGNKKIKKVVIGSSIISIGKNAFAKCTNLISITIGKNVAQIGKNAFAGCKRLKYIVIRSKKLTKKLVAGGAFSGIGKKTVVKVPISKYKAYRKLLRAKGLSKKVKIKKN